MHAWEEAGLGENRSPQGEGIITVFTEKHANAMRLTALSPRAQAIGLTVGLTLADARAREPGIAAVDRDHAAEARLLGRLLAGLVRYTPMAAAEPPDGLMLDITGCTHFYRGEMGLRADVDRRLAAARVIARTAIGHTPQAARALARFGGRNLMALPVAALEAPPEVELALRRAGLKTIADLAGRPRGPLAARFGDLPLRLARLLGEEDKRITPHRVPPPVAAVRRFAEPVARTEHALAVLAELVAEAGAELERRGQGGRRFEARFFRSDGAIAALAVETGRPARDPAILDRLFRERLEALSDPLDPGFGYDLIRLDVPRAEPMGVTQPGLDAPVEEAKEDMVALVDRLSARMGRRRLSRAQPHASHIPERAVAPLPPEAAPAAWGATEPGEPPLRPLLLFDPPQPVEVVAGTPDGPPKRFTWRRTAYQVATAEGPERIAPEWWRRLTSTGRTRDYYRIEDGAGHRFWLFRSGLFGDEGDPPRWYIHGRFA